MKTINDFFITKINKKQAIDAGMALVLILLLIGFFSKNVLYCKIAIPVLVLVMAVPMLVYPFAVFWFSFAHLMGTIISKILLTVIYVLIVLPVAIIRRIAGKDTLRLKQFKKSTESVMVHRDKWFTKDDVVTPY